MRPASFGQLQQRIESYKIDNLLGHVIDPEKYPPPSQRFAPRQLPTNTTLRGCVTRPWSENRLHSVPIRL